MSPVKEDLICEIIRISQRNLLGKNADWGPINSEKYEEAVLDWIRKNAASYRKHFHERLGDIPAQDLGIILKELKESQKDLNDMLEDSSAFQTK